MRLPALLALALAILPTALADDEAEALLGRMLAQREAHPGLSMTVGGRYHSRRAGAEEIFDFSATLRHTRPDRLALVLESGGGWAKKLEWVSNPARSLYFLDTETLPPDSRRKVGEPMSDSRMASIVDRLLRVGFWSFLEAWLPMGGTDPHLFDSDPADVQGLPAEDGAAVVEYSLGEMAHTQCWVKVWIDPESAFPRRRTARVILDAESVEFHETYEDVAFEAVPAEAFEFEDPASAGARFTLFFDALGSPEGGVAATIRAPEGWAEHVDAMGSPTWAEPEAGLLDGIALLLVPCPAGASDPAACLAYRERLLAGDDARVTSREDLEGGGVHVAIERPRGEAVQVLEAWIWPVERVQGLVCVQAIHTGQPGGASVETWKAVAESLHVE